MDLLFCEIFIEFREHCFSYYREEGPCLAEILPKKQVRQYDLVLHLLLKSIAGLSLDDVTWDAIRDEIRRELLG